MVFELVDCQLRSPDGDWVHVDIQVCEGLISSIRQTGEAAGSAAGALHCRYAMGGAYVLPGFIDVHTHLTGGDVLAGDDYYLSRRLWEGLPMQSFRSADAARRTLMAGFTTVRDVGSRDFLDVALRDAVAAGLVEGPRVVAFGRGLTPTGGHASLRAMEVDGLDGAVRGVRAHVKAHCDGVKLIGVTGGRASGQDVNRAQFHGDEIAAAADEAHRWGMNVAAHAHGATGIRNAVLAGVDSIEHGSSLDDELAELMAERGVVLVPTLSNYAEGDTERPSRDQALLSGIADRPPDIGVRLVELCRKHGVRMATGTDAGGNAHVTHGNNVLELRMLVWCGMSPESAVQSATSIGSQLLGIPSIGSVKKGFSADLVVFSDDPFKDADRFDKALSCDPTFVMAGGTVIRSSYRCQAVHGALAE